MTIKDLRAFYPNHGFYFFKEGKLLNKTPFYHDKIKGFKEVAGNNIFIEM